MSGLVKNQIVKQLARFTKNLSPNKISVKFMKGEGELHNLELNEKFLSELLELPPWLRLTKAVCNKISAKIHWTKLKTDPICLYLDRVEVDMEAVECGANPASHQTRHTPQQQPTKEKATNRYGFVEKVVDGMYVQINSVVISFKSSGFQASFQMSRLIIQSTNPDWKPEDLRLTRVKDEQRGEVLTFKEITWSTLRIDANALYDEKAKSPASSPLRLITSHSALHLTIKKRLEDCAVLSARLELILDDILWVLTHTQLQALAGFASSINQAMERAEGVKEPVASVPAGQAAQQPQYVPKKVDSQRDGSSLNMLFSQHDVPETSYHLRTGQIDFHLCDDSGLSAKERDPGANGAMHFQMKKLSLDYYPYHLAGTSRTCWPCHNEASLARAYWVNQLLNAFRALRNKRSGSVSSTHHRTHNDGSATGVVGRTGSTQPQANSAIPPSPRLRSRAHVSPLTSPQINPSPPANQRVGHSLSSAQKRPTFMYESCVVIRCDDFVIKQVTTSTTSGEGDPFLSSDKKALYLPSDMPAFQVDYTHYYYPSNNTSPVPAPNLFVQLNPIQFTFDATTCLWFNRFLRRVLENKIWSESFSQETSTAPSHVDIRVEALMPKVIIPCPSDPCAHYSDLRPQALQAQMSQASMTNTRIGANSTQTDLLVFLQRFNASKLYSDFLSFPNLPEDTRPLPNNIWLNDYSLLSSGREGEKLINGTLADVLKNKQPAQVWCISAEQVWLDFLRIDSMGNRPMPFVDAVPLSLWICTPLPGVESAHESEPSPSDVTVHSGKSPPAVVREELGQVRKRQTYWSGSQSAVASGDHKNLSPDLVARRKFTEPVQPQLLSNSLHNASSTPDLQRPPSQGENEVVFNRPVDGSNMNCTFTTADSTARQDRPCSSVPSSPRQRRTANLSNQAMESANEEKNTPQPCLSDSSSLRSLPESDSSGSQDGFVLLGRHPNGAPPAYDVVGDLPPPYEPYPQQRGPVQNGLHSSPICDAPETLPQEAPSLPEKVPLSPSSIACGGSDMDDQEAIPAQQAGLSVLVALTDRINVRFDHFQLMFLLRMQEMLVKTQEELERENAAFRREAQGESSSPAVTCSILTQDVELNVILPPKPEADTATASQNTSAIGSYHEVDILSDGRADSPDSNHISRLAPEKGSSSSKEALLSPGRNSNSKARSTSSAESLLNSRPESAQSTGGVSGRTSSASIPDAEAWSGIGQVGRRGSDSGSSINLDSGVSLKDSDGKSRRRNSSGKRVGIFAVEGSGFHVGIQLKEADTVVKVTGQEVKVDEQGTVNLEKYLNQKSLRTSRDKESMPVTPSSNPVVRVRAAFGPGAKQHELGGERGFALVKLTGVAASLLISSVQGLAECFEDELVLPPVPFVVELTNSRVTFNNDVPPTLLSAPPSVPINVAVEDVLIRRDPDGLISVKAIDTCSGVDDTDAPQAENVTRQDSIRSSSEVSLSDSVSSRIDSLENEKQALAAQLSVSRTALRSMHDERQALLHTVARLQQELSMSNREQERMQEKLIGQRRGGTTKWY